MKTFKQFCEELEQKKKEELSEAKLAGDVFVKGSGKCIVYDNGDVVYTLNNKPMSKEHLKDMDIVSYKDRLVKKNGWKKVNESEDQEKLDEKFEDIDLKYVNDLRKEAKAAYEKFYTLVEDIVKEVAEQSDYDTKNARNEVYKFLNIIDNEYNKLYRSITKLTDAAQGKR